MQIPMTPPISIYVRAAPDFEELLEIFTKFLSDNFALKLRAAANRYKEDCQELAAEYVRDLEGRWSRELLALEPALKEYVEVCQKAPHWRRIKLRALLHKIDELYGPLKPPDDEEGR